MAPIAKDASPTSVIRNGMSSRVVAVTSAESAGGERQHDGVAHEVEVGYHTPDRKDASSSGAGSGSGSGSGSSASRPGTPPPPAAIGTGSSTLQGILTSSGSTSAVSTPVASGRTPTRSGSSSVPHQPDLLAEALEQLEGEEQEREERRAAGGGEGAGEETLSSLGSGDMTEREVPYSSGATELFLAIEECRWDDAVTLCRSRPEQAKTWVKSSGSEQTSFDWNVWKRLPVHEACRRQPPPILISALLDAYPASCAAKTHFGELPLHLAIGCGSNPESIHLLLASYPIAATELDDAGRSPSDLVHEGIQPEDRAVVLGSLDRCLASQRQTESEWTARLDLASRRHADELDRLARENRKRLAVKGLALAELAREVQAGSERLESAAAEADERESEIQRRTRAERTLAEQARNAEEEVSRLRSANRDLKKRLGGLDGTVLRHETTIERLNGRIDALSQDLRTVCSMHDDLVRNDVGRVEREMVKLIRLQKGFLNCVRDRGDAIRTILAESDVEAPVPPSASASSLTSLSSPTSRALRQTGSDGTGGSQSSGDEASQGATAVGEAGVTGRGRGGHVTRGKKGGKGKSKSKGKAEAAKSPFQRRHEPPSAASDRVKEDGAAEQAIAMATVHLKKEKLLDGEETKEEQKKQ